MASSISNVFLVGFMNFHPLCMSKMILYSLISNSTSSLWLIVKGLLARICLFSSAGLLILMSRDSSVILNGGYMIICSFFFFMLKFTAGGNLHSWSIIFSWGKYLLMSFISSKSCSSSINPTSYKGFITYLLLIGWFFGWFSYISNCCWWWLVR